MAAYRNCHSHTHTHSHRGQLSRISAGENGIHLIPIRLVFCMHDTNFCFDVFGSLLRYVQALGNTISRQVIIECVSQFNYWKMLTLKHSLHIILLYSVLFSLLFAVQFFFCFHFIHYRSFQTNYKGGCNSMINIWLLLLPCSMEIETMVELCHPKCK